MQRFTFFVGKGGVGKTTVSSAYAIQQAARARRRKFLLISTDPAHSLGDVLQIKLSDRPKRLQRLGNLYARELDAEKRVQRFLAEERSPTLELLERGSLFSREELGALLDTSLPGMAEVAAVLALHDLINSEYDEIVVDTAPMGHTIRLFEMPAHLTHFLEVLETAAGRDLALARQFGGQVATEPALQRWSRMVERVTTALSEEASSLVLVTTAETFSLEEAARSADKFGRNTVREVVLNRAVTRETSCPRCSKHAKATEDARKFLARRFPGAQVRLARDDGAPILGIPALHAFGKHIFAGARLLHAPLPTTSNRPGINWQRAPWPRIQAPLTLTLGKGGVGKTTVSASLAFHQRSISSHTPVTICSIDPAPSLDDVFETEVRDEFRPVLGDKRLLAAELDAASEYQQWTARLKTKLDQSMSAERDGVHVDLSFDRRFLLALLDVMPPGVDELLAIFRILDLVKSGDSAVIDMAPTGHALEVLRTPDRLLAWARVLLKTLAAHRTLTFARDAAVELATVSQRVRSLAAMLCDPQQCAVALVTIPEVLPQRETQRLLQGLSKLGCEPALIFVNRVLMQPGRCARCRRQQQWQKSSLAEIRMREQNRNATLYFQREFNRELAGKKGLKQFTGELWRML